MKVWETSSASVSSNHEPERGCDYAHSVTAHFREEQRLPVWITVLVVIAAGASIAIFAVGMYIQLIRGEPWGDRAMSDTALAIVGGTFTLLGFGLIWLFVSLKLITEVHPDGLHIRFAPMRTAKVPYSRISSIEVETVRPIRDFGGWGVRYGRGTKAYLARGNTGVRVVRSDGKDIFVGSQQPDELAAAVRTWLRR